VLQKVWRSEVGNKKKGPHFSQKNRMPSMRVMQRICEEYFKQYFENAADYATLDSDGRKVQAKKLQLPACLLRKARDRLDKDQGERIYARVDKYAEQDREPDIYEGEEDTQVPSLLKLSTRVFEGFQHQITTCGNKELVIPRASLRTIRDAMQDFIASQWRMAIKTMKRGRRKQLTADDIKGLTLAQVKRQKMTGRFAKATAEPCDAVEDEVGVTAAALSSEEIKLLESLGEDLGTYCTPTFNPPKTT